MVCTDGPAASLYDLSLQGLRELLQGWGEPAYRSDQVWHWLYRHLAGSVDVMTTLPLALRRRLERETTLSPLALRARRASPDGLAAKFLYALYDGEEIETVLLRYDDAGDDAGDDATDDGGAARHAVCLSTQVGCAMGCVFCATGHMGLARDLTQGECVAQVVASARELATQGERLSNVVLMGMGEPLANWPAVRGALRTMVDPDGFAMSPRRITVSTVGLAPGIRRLADEGVPVRLAVSLHAADDDLRTRLVPLNRVHGLDEVLDACREYEARLGRRLTFEYVLIDGVNDGEADARALARRLRGMRAHVNLIPLNPTEGADLRPSRPAASARFQAALTSRGIPATLRAGRGIDIQAGCGQLRRRSETGRAGRTIARHGGQLLRVLE